MKKFTFSLEKVLRYKKLLEEQEKMQFARVYERHKSEKRDLEMLQTRYSENRQALFQGELRPSRLVHFSTSIQFLSQKISKQEERVNNSLQVLESQREKMIRARQEHEALVKLKEKKYREYEQEMAVEMQKEHDEIAVSAYNRRG